jgi:signal transduction histidine kinase
VVLTLGFTIDIQFYSIFSPFALQIYAFIFSSLFLGIILAFPAQAKTVPISHKDIIDYMQEGWIIVDSRNHVVDINFFAKKLLGLLENQTVGTHAKEIFFRLPDIAKALEKGQDTELIKSLKFGENFSYLNIKIVSLKEPRGSLIVLRDYTERRNVEKMRQQARDEMFSLLHSISGAASSSENTREFILASIYQLSYSFQSHSIAIFLKDENSKPDQRFLFISQIGIKKESVANLASIDNDNDLISEALKSRQSIQIKDTLADNRIPKSLRDIFELGLLLIPMISDDEFVGFIFLSCEEKSYSQSEITRLEMVAEQIGSFVRRDRRQNIASTLAERQRLIRDLHDSVTQRLYALVMATETAELAIQSEKIEQLSDIISNISSHTRQALKEMRLFLHKLQPIALAKDGLAAVLMHRLEAVEGRANLERTIDIDENLDLNPEEELALFFIAQEALNNIIKHANANFIKVTLKKDDTGIRLEIYDNGDGFEIGKIDHFGLGLKNMSERAKQINAILKINSSRNKGTRIIVLFRYANSPYILGEK